jgi:hypothetical protein
VRCGLCLGAGYGVGNHATAGFRALGTYNDCVPLLCFAEVYCSITLCQAVLCFMLRHAVLCCWWLCPSVAGFSCSVAA